MARASQRSIGRVTLILVGVPSTSAGCFPTNSMALASSVTADPASFADWETLRGLSSPQTVSTHGAGDCAVFAFFFKSVIDRNGKYGAFLMSLAVIHQLGDIGC